jgi:hypothetical protein
MEWIRQHVPRGATIQVSSGLEPFAAYFLTDYKIVPEHAKTRRREGQAGTAVNEPDRSNGPADEVACSVADRDDPSPQAINFRRPRQHLWALFNRRYFEASVLPRVSGVGSRVSE